MACNDSFHQLGSLQWRIMLVLWGNSPLTVAEICTKLEADKRYQKLAYTTVLTVCRNLAKHNYLVQDSSHRTHKFSPAITMTEYQRAATKVFVDTNFGGSAATAKRCIDDVCKSLPAGGCSVGPTRNAVSMKIHE